MTWQTAKSVAVEYLARMNLPSSLKGAEIRLADYETNADVKFMKSAEEWPLEFHRMVNGAIARELRKRGAAVTLVKISMAAYFDWLAKNDFKNDAGNRARFITQAIK
jgi:hypothetical protein